MICPFSYTLYGLGKPIQQRSLQLSLLSWNIVLCDIYAVFDFPACWVIGSLFFNKVAHHSVTSSVKPTMVKSQVATLRRTVSISFHQSSVCTGCQRNTQHPVRSSPDLMKCCQTISSDCTQASIFVVLVFYDLCLWFNFYIFLFFYCSFNREKSTVHFFCI